MSPSKYNNLITIMILKKVFMEKILVVEDDIIILKKLELILKSKNYIVRTAKNGIEALEELERNIPDLIISDINMPRMDGIELYKKITEEYKLINLPFIFLTAIDDLSTIRETLGLGADDHLLKSFSNEELFKSVKVRLKKSKESKQQINKIIENINRYVPHELKTPLFPILGWANIIADEIDNLSKEEIKEFVDKIIWSASRLLNRIEKFINMSELEALRDNEKSEILESVVLINEELIKNEIKNIYIIKDFKTEIVMDIIPASVKAKESYLKILIKELIENAVKFSESGNVVEIKAKPENSFYMISIKNTGLGLSKSDIAHINQFNQFERESINQIGNGLGLALVKKVIELFEGEMKIESSKKVETVVNIKLQLK